jgi:hypothetical protein
MKGKEKYRTTKEKEVGLSQVAQMRLSSFKGIISRAKDRENLGSLCRKG